MPNAYILHNTVSTVVNFNSSDNWRKFHCVTFHPNDDNIIFVFGGRNSGDLFENDIKTTLSPYLETDISPLPIRLVNLKCKSFTKTNGKPAILIVGGSEDGTTIDYVWEYDIESDSYTQKYFQTFVINLVKFFSFQGTISDAHKKGLSSSEGSLYVQFWGKSRRWLRCFGLPISSGE